MIQVLEKIYDGPILTSPTANLIYFRLPFDCDISDIRLIGTGFNSGLGNWLFNVSVAGANLFTGSGRITFNSSTNDVTKSSLATSGLQGDIVVLNLEQNGGGSLQSPITLLMTVDDGQTSGGGGAVHLPDIAPASPNAFDDEFDGNTLDAKWTKYGSSDLVETFGNGSINLGALSNSNGFTGIYQAIPSGDWDWVTKVLFPQSPIPSGQTDFSLAIFDNAASTGAALVVAATVNFGTGTATFNLPGVYLFSDRVSFSSTIESADPQDAVDYSVLYFRIKKVGNAYSFYRSRNGVTWEVVGSGTGIADITASPTSFTPNHIGLVVRNTGGSTRNVAFIDFTRIYTTLPSFMSG